MRSELQIFEETLVIEALLSDRFVKVADGGIISGLVDTIKGYTENHIDENNKAASVMNLLVPGVLTMLGSPWLAMLYELADSVFHINLSGIFSSIATGIGSLISGGKQTNSSSVGSVIMSAFSSLMESGDQNKTSGMTLREAQLFKVALDNFVQSHPDFATSKPRMQIKLAVGFFGLVKSKAIRALFSAIKWIVLVILASAGFMVAGDTIHGLVGSTKPSVSKPGAEVVPTVPGTVLTEPGPSVELQVNPNYSEENNNSSMSSWTIPGSVSSIGQMILSWTGEIYPQLAGYNVLVSSTSGYNKIVREIQQANSANKLGFISIPKQYKSRKQIVDTFVPEIQNKLNQMAASAPKQ